MYTKLLFIKNIVEVGATANELHRCVLSSANWKHHTRTHRIYIGKARCWADWSYNLNCVRLVSSLVPSNKRWRQNRSYEVGCMNMYPSCTVGFSESHPNFAAISKQTSSRRARRPKLLLKHKSTRCPRLCLSTSQNSDESTTFGNSQAAWESLPQYTFLSDWHGLISLPTSSWAASPPTKLVRHFGHIE